MRFPKILKIALTPLEKTIEIQLSPNNSTELKSGTDADLIKDLSESIGFDYEIYTPADGEWGRRKIDGSWTGTLGMLERGDVDMAIAPLLVTEDRYNSFILIPYTVFQYGFVTNKPHFKFVTSRFDSPFQIEVWIACVAVILAITLMLWLISRRHCSIADAVIKILGILLHQDPIIRGSSFVTRVIVGCWMLGSMFLTFSYSAVLLSFMTLPGRDEGIRTIDELSEAVLNRGYKFLCPEGSAIAEIISRNPNLRGMSEKFIKNNWTYKFANGVHPQQFDMKTAIFGTKIALQLSYGVEPFTNKIISSDTIAVVNGGLAVRKTFCCAEILRRHLNLIVAAGMYSGYARKVLTQTSHDLLDESEDNSIRSLSVTDLREIFIFGLFGILSAFLVLLVEILTSKCTFNK